jgi:hypothetical protein
MKLKNSLSVSLNIFLPILTITIISLFLYYSSRNIPNYSLRIFLASASGLVYFICILFSPLFIFILLDLKGIGFKKAVSFSLVIPVLWMIKDVIVLIESHPFIEALYWLLNPLYIWYSCLLIIDFGFGTLLVRYIKRRQGSQEQVFTAKPVIAILVAVTIAAGIFAWGQGENIYSLYLDGYRLLYGFGIH